MMEIQTLENINTNELLDTFNLAFSDYIVPMQLNRDQLEQKITIENIQLSLSVSAFKEGKLIAFVLHGLSIINNERIVYNAGTGVLPAERGQGITSKLYEYILPVLKAELSRKIILEVISTNESAIKTYKSIGFITDREFDCYKGTINSSPYNIPFRLKNLTEYNWELQSSFWDWAPSLPNSMEVMNRLFKTNVSIGLYTNDVLIGYLIYNPGTKRVQQFAVSKQHRRQGVGKALFGHIAQAYDEAVAVINVDNSSGETKSFLESIGLQCFLKQYEMEMPIN